MPTPGLGTTRGNNGVREPVSGKDGGRAFGRLCLTS